MTAHPSRVYGVAPPSSPQLWDEGDAGTEFSSLRSLCEIGSGSFASVYKVEAPRGRHFALKVQPLQHEDFSSALTHARLVTSQQLCDLTNAVDAPVGLAKVFKAWREGGTMYVLMTLCDTSLDVFTGKCQPLTEAHAWRMLSEVGSALRYMHAHGLAHNDVKPANVGTILLPSPATSSSVRGRQSAQLSFRLIDYGSTCRLDSTSSHIHASAMFMSPEMLANDNVASSASDIYALGVTVLAACTGYVPRRDHLSGEPIRTAKHIASLSSSAPSSLGLLRLSSRLVDLIDGMLCVSVDERLTSTDVISEATYVLSQSPA